MELLSSEQILSYIKEELAKHRATLKALKEQGKSYRTREMTITMARINTLLDVQFIIELPQKNAHLREAMGGFRQSLKG